MKNIRALGRIPKRHPKATMEQPELFRENKLAECYKKMKRRFTTEEQAELCGLPQDPDAKATTLAAGLKDLGHLEAAGRKDDPSTPARASASSSSRATGGASQPAASPAAACAASPACATPAPAAQASDTMTPRTTAVVEQVLALGHAPRNVGGEDKLRRALQRKREEAKTSTDAEAQLQVLPQGHRSDCDK